MINQLVKKIFGTKHERELKKMQPLVQQIGTYEKRFKDLSDDELKGHTALYKERIAKGESLDKLLPEVFATVRCAGVRSLGMRHYDVQLIGGIVMHRGRIAEMKTGEGKTLTATLAIYLNALPGKGAHLVTVNDYLASRDAEWMGELYGYLGMSTGAIVSGMAHAQRKAAYASDITYGTNNEFGFDYLRDNMVPSLDRMVQRGLHYAIVDEVDSILIDESRTPLIISGQTSLSEELYHKINDIIVDLIREEDYTVNEEHRSVALTDEGVEKVEERLSLDNLYDIGNIETVHHVNKALEAHTLYRKGEQYLVKDEKIVIVDEFTGRAMDGRRWSDGLHQAIEAKEGVPIKPESVTLATITYQNFFRMYDKLSGMTGTADTEAEEFQKNYDLSVSVIPTNKPILRDDMSDIVFRTEREKFKSIIDQIEFCHEKGQPVLVGTISVDKSEVISKILKKNKIPHEVLNAKQHGREAHIVAQAGRKGAVTIATNMAGRGTDIRLGGNPEELAQQVAPEGEGDAYESALSKFTEQCVVEKQEVLDAGGLFILGTERHDSRRIDNQLRGRSGRQGDPGGSRFFISLEDDLMKRFGADKIMGLMERLGMEEGVPIEANMVNRSIENAQSRVEGRNADIRKHLLEYDDVMSSQRDTIYTLRRSILENKDAMDLVLDMLEEALIGVLDQFANPRVRVEDWDFPALVEALNDVFCVEIDPDSLPLQREKMEEKLWAKLQERLRSRVGQLQRVADEIVEERDELAKKIEEIEAAHAARVTEAEEAGEEPPAAPNLPKLPEPKTKEDVFADVVQQAYLGDLDKAWQDHLRAMRLLRDSVSLHGYAQKDPKQIYKKEGYELFERLKADLSGRVARKIMRVVVPTPEQIGTPELSGMYVIRSQRALAAERARREEEARKRLEAQRTRRAPGSTRPSRRITMSPANGLGAAAAAAGRGAPALPKLGRNDPCWCGSGKKYKHCHMRIDQAKSEAVATSKNAAVEAAQDAAPTATPGEAGEKKTGGVSII